MKITSRPFSLLSAGIILFLSGANVSAQSNSTIVCAPVKPHHSQPKAAVADAKKEENGTVLSHYHGVGDAACENCDEAAVPADVYCYQCRAFHTNTDYAYYNNRENYYELQHRHPHYVGVEGCSDCGDHAPVYYHHAEEGCTTCGDVYYEPDLYNMDHEYDNCGGDYLVKYRGNKVKVKCASCNAKWKYYYNDYHSNNHYVYDKDDRVIVSYHD